jgi:hypothetical protein
MNLRRVIILLRRQRALNSGEVKNSHVFGYRTTRAFSSQSAVDKIFPQSLAQRISTSDGVPDGYPAKDIGGTNRRFE